MITLPDFKIITITTIPNLIVAVTINLLNLPYAGIVSIIILAMSIILTIVAVYANRVFTADEMKYREEAQNFPVPKPDNL